MNTKKNIISSAKKVLAKELESIKTISSVFNDNFFRAVEKIHKLKGRVIVTGVGKSAHVGNKISATLTSTGTSSFFIELDKPSNQSTSGRYLLITSRTLLAHSVTKLSFDSV